MNILPNPLSHIDSIGNPKMVDISNKIPTVRSAQARIELLLPSEVDKLFSRDDIITKKGSLKQTCIIAGTMGIKKTSEIIPFCHPITIEGCKIEIKKKTNTLEIQCEVKTTSKTGVEMEALYGCQIAALTAYDMLKAVSHKIIITNLKLIHKTGGKSNIK